MRWKDSGDSAAKQHTQQMYAAKHRNKISIRIAGSVHIYGSTTATTQIVATRDFLLRWLQPLNSSR